MPRVLAVAMTLSLLATGAVASTQAPEAVSLTDEASDLVRADRLPEALALLDRALDADPEYWEAHYQRGRVLGLLERMPEALGSLLRATELNPGFAHAHELAAIAAYRIEDWDTAWEEAIRAELAGVDMSDRFQLLLQHTEAPPDILRRLSAPRLLVAPLDVSEIGARAELPFNRNPAEEPNRLSDRPDPVQGRFRLSQAASELVDLQRRLRAAVSRAPYLGLTQRAEQAQLILVLSIDELGERPPRHMVGSLRVLAADGETQLYRRRLELRDITSQGAVVGSLERAMNELEGWVASRRDH